MTDDTRETADEFFEALICGPLGDAGMSDQRRRARRMLFQCKQLQRDLDKWQDAAYTDMVRAEGLEDALAKAERERDEYKRQADGYYGEAAKALDERDEALAEVERLKGKLAGTLKVLAMHNDALGGEG